MATGALLFAFFTAVAVLQVQRLGERDEDAIAAMGGTILAFAYCGLAGAFLYKVRLMGVGDGSHQVEGIRHLLYFVLVVKSTDIGAYFTGRNFGATKLIEKLSPGKTVEGLIGGVLCAMMLAVVLNWIFNIGDLSFFGASKCLKLRSRGRPRSAGWGPVGSGHVAGRVCVSSF